MYNYNEMIRLTQEYFILKANEVHKNKYDYSEAVYLKGRGKVKIICPIHGVFEQWAANHLLGQGCLKCADIQHGLTKRENYAKIFIRKANEIHNYKYDYSHVVYTISKQPVEIICPVHGSFFQTPNSHLQGRGCPLCKAPTLRKCFQSTTVDFIAKSNRVHMGKYDYSKVDYVNSWTKVIIRCSKHGVFLQRPTRHLAGDGCPICNESHGEIMIANILKKHNIKFKKQKTFPTCKKVHRLRFDFYLEDYNVLIEYQGRQHFNSYVRFGGDGAFLKRIEYDGSKKNWAMKNNILLQTYKYDDTYSFIERDILKLILKHNNKWSQQGLLQFLHGKENLNLCLIL
jgi:hypothetical protein